MLFSNAFIIVNTLNTDLIQAEILDECKKCKLRVEPSDKFIPWQGCVILYVERLPILSLTKENIACLLANKFHGCTAYIKVGQVVEHHSRIPMLILWWWSTLSNDNNSCINEFRHVIVPVKCTRCNESTTQPLFPCISCQDFVCGSCMHHFQCNHCHHTTPFSCEICGNNGSFEHLCPTCNLCICAPCNQGPHNCYCTDDKCALFEWECYHRRC